MEEVDYMDGVDRTGDRRVRYWSLPKILRPRYTARSIYRPIIDPSAFSL
jgi:hypothetical protein